MEESCAWCGRPFDGRATSLAHRRRCPSCHVDTTTPWPSTDELQMAYGTWYRPESGRFSGVGDKLFKLLRGGFSRRLLSIAPEGPILDVGAGDGSLIDSVRAKGRDAVGLDPYSERADFIKEPIEELADGWAAIVFWHSLEHVPNPTHHLAHAARALMPGGVLVVAVPNPSSVQAQLLGGRWLHLDYPRHLVHIPPGALTKEVTRLGLRVDRLSFYRGGNVVFGWLHGLVGTVGGDLDLYDAIRKPEARSRPMTASKRLIALALGAILLPIALVASVVEVAIRRGGTIYVEASKP